MLLELLIIHNFSLKVGEWESSDAIMEIFVQNFYTGLTFEDDIKQGGKKKAEQKLHAIREHTNRLNLHSNNRQHVIIVFLQIMCSLALRKTASIVTKLYIMYIMFQPSVFPCQARLDEKRYCLLRSK